MTRKSTMQRDGVAIYSFPFRPNVQLMDRVQLVVLKQMRKKVRRSPKVSRTVTAG